MPDSTFLSAYWLERSHQVQHPEHRGDCSNYMPHQGAQECARRVRNEIRRKLTAKVRRQA